MTKAMRIVGMFSNVGGYTAARDTLAGISCEQLRQFAICQPQRCGTVTDHFRLPIRWEQRSSGRTNLLSRGLAQP